MVWWIWLILAAYLLLTAFVIWQLGSWVKFANPEGRLGLYKWIIPVIVVISSFPVIGTFLPESELASFFQKYGNIWLGILAMLGAALLLALIMRIFVRNIHPRYARNIILAVFIFAVGVNAIGMHIAQDIQIKYYRVGLGENGTELLLEKDKLPSKPEGIEMRIAFLTDIHMGVNTSLRHLQRMSDYVTKAGCDLVLGGGDYFTSSYIGLEDEEIAAHILKSAESVHGTYCAYGNHDVTEKLFCGFAVTDKKHAIRYKEMDDFFKYADWKMIADDTVDIDGIQFVFRKDGEKTGDGINSRKSVEEILANVDKNRPVVVIEHEPKDLQSLAQNGADIVLSGHTHNGQIFPGNIYGKIDAKRHNSNSYGIKKFDNMLSVVGSGIGYYGPPIRIGTNSELIIMDITY